jgi:hypothetical protein
MNEINTGIGILHSTQPIKGFILQYLLHNVIICNSVVNVYRSKLFIRLLRNNRKGYAISAYRCRKKLGSKITRTLNNNFVREPIYLYITNAPKKKEKSVYKDTLMVFSSC